MLYKNRISTFNLSISFFNLILQICCLYIVVILTTNQFVHCYIVINTKNVTSKNHVKNEKKKEYCLVIIFPGLYNIVINKIFINNIANLI